MLKVKLTAAIVSNSFTFIIILPPLYLVWPEEHPPPAATDEEQSKAKVLDILRGFASAPSNNDWQKEPDCPRNERSRPILQPDRQNALADADKDEKNN